MLVQNETSQGIVDSYFSGKENGPTIVFLPGNSSNHREFKKILKSDLSVDFRLIAIDYIPVKDKHNFLSIHPEEICSATQRSASVILEVLAANNIDPGNVAYFGHGYGANVAVNIAEKQEKNKAPVKGVMTVGFASTHNTLEGLNKGYDFSPAVVQALSKEELDDADAKIYATAVGFDPEDPEHQFAIDAARQTDGRFRANLFATFTNGLDERIYMKSTETPMIVMHGEKDANVKLNYLEKLKSKNPCIQLEVIKGAPQASYWTHADEVVIHIKKFMEKIFKNM